MVNLFRITLTSVLIRAIYFLAHLYKEIWSTYRIFQRLNLRQVGDCRTFFQNHATTVTFWKIVCLIGIVLPIQFKIHIFFLWSKYCFQLNWLIMVNWKRRESIRKRREIFRDEILFDVREGLWGRLLGNGVGCWRRICSWNGRHTDGRGSWCMAFRGRVVLLELEDDLILNIWWKS